jgi:two-component system KDP operon response regulator KdpE
MTIEQPNAGQGTILVVDDDNSLRKSLHLTLSGMGFTIVDAARGEEALSLTQVTKFDAVLLDVDIPGMGGVEACRSIRRRAARLPILMLSVMDSMDIKEQAFDAGADDYVTKPFQLRELAARLRAAVRRKNTHETRGHSPIRQGQLQLDPGKYLLQKRGRTIHLTPKEFELLRYLMSNAGKSIRRAQLLNAVWGPDHANEFVYLRMYVSHLRRKIEDDPLNPHYLLTVPNIGYMFNEQQAGS